MLPNSIKPRFFDTLSNMTGRYIKPTPYHKATGLVAKVYEQVADEFFINGPITTHAINPQLLAGVWMAEREIMLADNLLSREDKEALGVTFSQVNGCSYCEDLINSVVYGADEGELAEQMRYRRQDEIEDDKIRFLHLWANNSYNDEAKILFSPPFSPDEAPEVIGTALMFNYFNRYVKVFFSGTPLIAPFSSKTVKSMLYRLTGRELHDSVIRRLKPGRAIALLEPADLPPDFCWAAGNNTISAAVSRWAAAVDRAADECVPESIRARIEAEISTWKGEQMGLGRSWLIPKTVGFTDEESAVVRLALLTAFAPGQLSDDIIADYRKYYPSDIELVVTVAWAAFSASKRVANWLADKSGYFADEMLGEAI